MSKETKTEKTADNQRETCGIIMPISAIDGLSDSHWSEVREIISDCIEQAGFTPNLVSNADEVGVIQKRIIENLYTNPIVVCDVSGKNPNVMFELGMRLAFDKPTIVIKDDATSYSFDTSPIEHIGYPRDLRYTAMTEFKEKLTEKIRKTHEAFINNNGHNTFLKTFGEFKVAKIDTKEVSADVLVMEELKAIRYSLNNLQTSSARESPIERRRREYTYYVSIMIPQGEFSDSIRMEFITLADCREAETRVLAHGGRLLRLLYTTEEEAMVAYEKVKALKPEYDISLGRR